MTSGINGWKKREFEEASLRVKNFITKRIEEEELLTKGKREGEREKYYAHASFSTISISNIHPKFIKERFHAFQEILNIRFSWLLFILFNSRTIYFRQVIEINSYFIFPFDSHSPNYLYFLISRFKYVSFLYFLT